ncbi:protein ECERIFERUM 26-like [Iris pallida]|uniref:Protein ECERIFERUM 26-like n=1 Tax=Iris pallida TaxID=29817 RepID=A0AAX6G133_IRIPA|nr:protein ECERIFERUM 26-like [Iris pallida]
MVSDTNENLDSNALASRWLSTAVPASMTVDHTDYQLSGMDLAMKLHYLRILYYFQPSETIVGLTARERTSALLKDPLFLTLDHIRQVAGRIRKDGTGRPHIKCNDSRVRVVEVTWERSVEEWLEDRSPDRDSQLVPDEVLGPDLVFSPLAFVEFTRFKCGGLAVGVSWSHVLGDAVSASKCINLWGSLLSGSPKLQKSNRSSNPKNLTVTPATRDPLSTKQVELNGDLWLPHTEHRMVTSSFKVSRTKLNRLQSKTSSGIPAFEAIAALMWKMLAKIRVGKNPSMVTVIRNDCSEERNTSLSNKQIISTVATDSSLAKLEISELAMLISETSKDEKQAIGEMLERENGTGDFIIYGAYLTFVDMERVDLYGLELKGQKPVCVEYNICGVGEEGAIMVLQEPDDAREGSDNGGKQVVVILP